MEEDCWVFGLIHCMKQDKNKTLLPKEGTTGRQLVFVERKKMPNLIEDT